MSTKQDTEKEEHKTLPTAFSNTITTALGTVAALTWTDAIKTLFQQGGLFSSSKSWAPWMAAIFATILAVWGTKLLSLVMDQVETNFLGKLVKKQPEKPVDLSASVAPLDGLNAAEPMEYI